MKTTINPLFSNGTEMMMWQDRNCNRCVKQSTYNEKTDEYTAFRCAIDRDIQAQACGLNEVSQRSYDATKKVYCPYIQTVRKLTHKHRPIKGQMEIKL
jgi:hypothetical protein